MWKLVIIDDDNIILRGLSRNIPWEANGFQLVGLAKNGEDGLQLIKQEKPQVVITDIRMPFMDGLELTEKVKEQYPEIKIIMMTGYEEFEFAQKALQLKVFDFVLKPVENETLLAISHKAAEEWEKEQAIVTKAIPLLKQRFFESLIRGNLRATEIAVEMEFLELVMEAKRYVVIVLKADAYHEPDYKNRFGREMLKYCIHNLTEELIGPTGGNAFDSLEDETVLIFKDEGDKETAQRNAYRTAEEIRIYVEKFLKTTVTIGIGSVCSNLTELRTSYQDALVATEFRHLTGTNQVYTIQDTWLRASSAPSVPNQWQDRELGSKVKLGLEKEALSILDQIELEVTENYLVSLDRLRLICMEMAFMLANLFPDMLDLPYQGSDVQRLLLELQQLRTARELFDRIRLVVQELTLAIKERFMDQQKLFVHQACTYIQTHYSREGLSLQDVADYIHISPTYLSIIFKREKNINFSDYLLETRMNAAMTLLMQKDYKTYEVAEKVGYGNSQYFSVSFKKFTGLSPTEFKQSRA